MNLQELREKAIKLINFYSISGNIIPETDNSYLDYKLRINALTDIAQKEIATTAKRIRKQQKITQKPIASQLPNPLYNFDIVQHLDSDIIYSATGSKAYTFKVDNVSTVYIEESSNSGSTWTTLSTISHTTPLNQFTEYKGLITLSNTSNLARIRFSGNYPYNFRDVALFAYTFPNVSAIPQYQNYNLYTMPSDFYQLNKITLKGNRDDGNRYTPTADFYWEKRNVLAVNYYNVGEYVIDYYAYPTTINDSTSDLFELEIDIEAQEAIPYYVASHLMMDENGNINNKLYGIYQGKLSNLDDKVSNGSTSISNTLFSDTYANRLF